MMLAFHHHGREVFVESTHVSAVYSTGGARPYVAGDDFKADTALVLPYGKLIFVTDPVDDVVAKLDLARLTDG